MVKLTYVERNPATENTRYKTANFRSKSSALDCLIKWNKIGSNGPIQWVYNPIDIEDISIKEWNVDKLHPDDR